MRYLVAFPILLMSGVVAFAADIVDATGRTVTVPDRVERVMASGPPASTVLYVLAPQKMIGWVASPRPNEREFLLPATRDLPELGRLAGRGDTANVEVVLKEKPDLIFDFGSASPTFVSLAERVQEQTGIPYLLFSGRFEQTAASLRALGKVLGVQERAEEIARYAEQTERLIDERLKDLPANARKRVYLARQPNGLETGLTGSINTEIIERAGGISGGQRQLTLIARALAQEAPILALDEPTASLDFGNQTMVLGRIRDLAAQGYGIVLSTHDPDHALLVGTRVAIIADGGLRAVGMPQEVVTAEMLSAIYRTGVIVEDTPSGRRVCVPAWEKS